jgi:hypothetical protein
LYAELEDSREECRILRGQLEQLGGLEKLCNSLEIKLQKARKERQEAKASLRDVQNELETSKESNVRLVRRVERMKRDIEDATKQRQQLDEISVKKDQEVCSRNHF